MFSHKAKEKSAKAISFPPDQKNGVAKGASLPTREAVATQRSNEISCLQPHQPLPAISKPIKMLLKALVFCNMPLQFP